MTTRRSLLVAPVALALAGCGEGQWLGPNPPPPLPGKRIPVLLLDDGPTADPRIQALTVTLPAPVQNSAWPQVGGDPSHLMGHLAAAADLKLAWQASAGSGGSGSERVLCTPIVANDVVYTIDAAGNCSAFDAGSGREIWSVHPETSKQSDRLTGGGIGFDGGRLYITRSHGDVFALDPAKGATIWRQKIRAPLKTAPTVSGGRVLVRTADNQLFALSTADGTVVWTHAGLFQQAGILGGAPPAAQREFCVVAYSSGEVFALLLDSGRPVWSDTVVKPRRTLAIDTITDITGAPVIDQDRVLVAGNGGEMAEIDLQQGGRIWDISITSLQTPWVAGEFIYLTTERGEVVCLLRQGGRIRWVSPLARATGEDASASLTVWAGPLLVGDRLLTVSSKGDIVSVSPYTGEILGHIKPGYPMSLPPIVAKGTVYVLTDDARLLAYR
jgi:outer membrane protein assembly factor BamB